MHRLWLWIVAPLALIACAGDQARIDEVLGLTGDPETGKLVFVQVCAECHRVTGLGEDDPDEPGIGENLTELGDEEDEELVEVILFGEEEMPAFEDKLTPQQVADVLAYVHEAFAPVTEPAEPTDE